VEQHQPTVMNLTVCSQSLTFDGTALMQKITGRASRSATERELATDIQLIALKACSAGADRFNLLNTSARTGMATRTRLPREKWDVMQTQRRF
jgi:hypothetical protein